MGTRILLFIGFCALVIFFLTLGGYQDLFDQKKPLNTTQISQAKEAYAAKLKAIAEGATKPKEELQEAADVMDMNDPEIKNGILVYTEKGQCMACHGQNGEGVAEKEGPLLAGQHDWYIIDQLSQMQAGQRTHVSDGTELASLSEQEIKDVAKYIKYLRVQQ